jgi:hypothetical protein
MSRRLNDATPAEWDAACSKVMKREPSTEAKEFIAKVRSLRASESKENPHTIYSEDYKYNTMRITTMAVVSSFTLLLGLFIGITLF